MIGSFLLHFTIGPFHQKLLIAKDMCRVDMLLHRRLAPTCTISLRFSQTTFSLRSPGNSTCMFSLTRFSSGVGKRHVVDFACPAGN